ncbi:MAG: methyl-accepting chemotaxis protein [Candidatus Heimdallarchaeota archaeon]|nr:methyl-accepting chemotaxis protein [Candidatus Heimdallarchaeota archaeon]MDH5644396.1 methyl-accepting chemotaxis protein [Candidatus Heimdallarchaeota archaeon]
MALLDENEILGVSWSTFVTFLIVGALLSFTASILFRKIYGNESLSYKLVNNVLILFAPISIVGFTIGINLNSTKALDEKIVNISVISAFMLFFAIYILFNINKVVKIHMQEINQITTRVAKGDLTTPHSFNLINQNDILFPFYQSFTHMLENLRNVVSEILQTAGQVATTAEEIASSTSEVSSSSSSISSIMDNISRGSQVQVQKVQDARGLEEEMEKVIESSFERIFESIELVQEISEETNLLALNASIEAQRAGQAGRGFSIVAQNVRKLSDDTRTYSDQVLELLNEIEINIKSSQQNISKSIAQIRDVSEDVASSSEEVSASAEEQAATLEEMAAGSHELARLAGKLEEIVRQFNVK